MSNLIERLGNLARSEQRRTAMVVGLQPVHLQILAYLDRCNRYSNTPAATAAYLGVTRGTLSQSLAVLERNRMIVKQSDSRDRRVLHMTVTATGRHLLRRALAPAGWASALDASEASETVRSLGRLLAALQTVNSFKTFGTCGTCRHLLCKRGARYRCGLTRDPLSRSDTEKLCFEHEPPTLGG